MSDGKAIQQSEGSIVSIASTSEGEMQVETDAATKAAPPLQSERVAWQLGRRVRALRAASKRVVGEVAKDPANELAKNRFRYLIDGVPLCARCQRMSGQQRCLVDLVVAELREIANKEEWRAVMTPEAFAA